MTELTEIILRAKLDFINTHNPNDAVEINSGYCRHFINYVKNNYDLPDNVERVDAFDVHSWFYYEGKHYDVEHPYGVSNAEKFSVWKRITNPRLKIAVNNTKYLTKNIFN